MSNQDDASQEGITVAIRMRPLNRVEGDKQRIWKVLPKYNSITQTTNSGKPLSERVTGRTFFTFDKVFGEDVNTEQVYDSVAKGIISSVVSGLNGTIFAYGQTSSGKTYTMQGSGSIEDGASSVGGVVHMAATDIFSQIQSQSDRMFLVRASFLEIYNEEVRDLLSNSNQTLPIREDPRRGVFVQAEEEIVTDFESLLKLLFRGEKSRAVAATGMNERSSRSHTIFRITIESRVKDLDDETDENQDPSDGAVRISTLNLVDLAGSESVRHTGATGDRQKEGGMINQSLLTLSRVIVALGRPNQMHINFRDSKLTRILQPSLSGNARMAVICCATPSELYLEETRSTLQFASRAKLVKTNAQVNEVLDDRSIIRKLQRELAEARKFGRAPGSQELRDLENKAETAGTAALEAKQKLNRLKTSILNAGYLFSNGTKKNTKQQSQRPRKRRQSDSFLQSRLLSPGKTNETSLKSPRTLPKKKREKRSHPTLTPQSEISIIRNALASRTYMTRSLKRVLQEQSESLEEKQLALQELDEEKQDLHKSRDEMKDEIQTLRNDLIEAQSRLTATITEYDILISEKDNAIGEALHSFETQGLEIAELRDEYAWLQEDFVESKKKIEELGQGKAESTARVADLSQENDKLKQECQRKIAELQEKLTSQQEAFTQELEAMEQLIAKKDSALVESESKSSELNGRVSALEQTVSDMSKEKHLLSDKLAETTLEKDQEDFVESKKKIEELGQGKAESTARVADLSQENDKLKQECQRKIAELQEKLTSQQEAFTQELEAMEQLIAKKDSALVESESKSSELNGRVSALEQTVSDMSKEKHLLSDKLAETTLEKDQLQESYRLVSGEMEEKERACEALQDEQALKQKALDASLERETSLSASLAKFQEDAWTQMRTYENHIAALESEASMIKNELCSSQEDRLCLSKQVERLEGEAGLLVDRLTSLESEVEISKQTENVLMEQNQNLAAHNESLQDALGKAHSNLQISECKVDELESELTNYQNVLKETQCDLLKSKEQLKQLSDDHETLINESARLRSEASDVRSDFIHARTQITSKEIEKSDLVNEIGSLKQQLQTIKSEYESTKTEVSSKTGMAQELKLHIEKLESDSQAGLTAKETELTDALKQRDELALVNHNLQTQLEQQASTNAEIASETQRLQKEIEKSTDQNSLLQQRICQLIDEKTELDGFVAASQDELRTVKEEFDSNEIELGKARVLIDQLSMELSTNKDQVSETQRLEEELSLANQKVGTTEEMAAELKKEHASLEETVEQLRHENQSLQERINLSVVERVEMESKMMSLEADKVAAVAESNSTSLNSHDDICSLEQQVKSLKEDIEELQTEKASLLETIDSHKKTIENFVREKEITEVERSSLTADIEKQTQQISELLEQINDLQSNSTEKGSNLDEMEQLNGDLQKELDATRKTVDDKSYEVQELANQYDELKRNQDRLILELEQATSSKNNAMSIMKDREQERDEATAALYELQQKNQELTTKLTESLPLDRAQGFEKELAELKRSNIELNQLLVSTNESEQYLREQVTFLENQVLIKDRDLEDREFRLKQLEEELKQTEIAYEEKLRNQSFDGTLGDDNALLEELQSTRNKLAEERRTRQASEEALKKQMGEEQRMLVQEGEKLMEGLRTKVQALEKDLVDSQEEAYVSRQSLEQLRDEKTVLESRYKEQEVSLSNFKEEAAKHEAHISSLEADLHRARTDSYASKENAIEIKERIRKASREVDKAVREKEVAVSELSVLKRKVSSLEKSNSELNNENDKLKFKVRERNDSHEEMETMSEQIQLLQKQVDLKTEEVKQLNETIEHLSNGQVLSSDEGGTRIEELKSQIKQKDQRIKKLEAVRLTKEQVESIKKLKSDNNKYSAKISKLTTENSSLKAELQSSTDGSSLTTEISELRFDKEALERKLRKFAKQCQRLEEDKAGMVDALRSCRIDVAEFNGEIIDAVVSLCDKVTSLEQASSSTEVGVSKELSKENRELQSRLQQLESAEEQLLDKVTSYETEISNLKGKIRKMSENQDDAVGENTEMTRKLRYLEQENLQLMFDVKTAKKQLHNAREELEVLRMNGVDNATFDFGNVDLGSNTSSSKNSTKEKRVPPSSFGEDGSRKKQVLAEDKENSANHNLRPSGLPKSRRERPAAPGLGQAAVEGDDTAECKQS